MAKHYLNYGGRGPAGSKTNLLPAVPTKSAEEYNRSSYHKTQIDFSLTRHLTFFVNRRFADHGGGSPALADYIKTNTIAANDEIIAVVLPLKSLVSEVYWEVTHPVAGITFDLVILDTFGGLGGNKVLATGLDGSQKGFDMIDVTAQNGGAKLFLKENAELALIPTALPANGIKCFGVKISPTLREFERGVH